MTTGTPPADEGSAAVCSPARPWLAISATLAIALADTRQRFDLVIRRRAGQRPFQRRRAPAPGIVPSLQPGSERAEDIAEAHDHPEPRPDTAHGCRLLPIHRTRRVQAKSVPLGLNRGGRSPLKKKKTN